jgi:hypothetical protein
MRSGIPAERQREREERKYCNHDEENHALSMPAVVY